MSAHSLVRLRVLGRKNLSRPETPAPYRQRRPTTSESDVRLSCSDRDGQRKWPCLACPRAAAHIWGNGALILQRVQEYHIAPPGLTAKRPRKSSIFSRKSAVSPSCPQLQTGFVRSRSVYRCISRRFSSKWTKLHDHGNGSPSLGPSFCRSRNNTVPTEYLGTMERAAPPFNSPLVCGARCTLIQ